MRLSQASQSYAYGPLVPPCMIKYKEKDKDKRRVRRQTLAPSQRDDTNQIGTVQLSLNFNSFTDIIFPFSSRPHPQVLSLSPPSPLSQSMSPSPVARPPGVQCRSQQDYCPLGQGTVGLGSQLRAGPQTPLVHRGGSGG